MSLQRYVWRTFMRKECFALLRCSSLMWTGKKMSTGNYNCNADEDVYSVFCSVVYDRCIVYTVGKPAVTDCG